MKLEMLPIGRDTLGECPVWSATEGALYWVDQMTPRVRRFVPATGAVHEWLTPESIGSIGLAGKDRLIMALSSGFHHLDLNTGLVTPLAEVAHAGPGIRMNDGRCDRSGRFVAGSLAFEKGTPDGCLYRLNPGGSVEVLHRGIIVTNGVCFNAAGDRMYFADSRTGILMVCEYESAGTSVGEPKPFADTRPFGSVPDGATVDEEGGVWIALIENGQVVRFLPDGTMDRTIQLPVPHVTSVCFGGPELDTLYVTTVRDTGMRLRTDHPSAGAVFRVTDLGVRGVEEGHFGNGS
ncbi:MULTISPECIES: SMP-30/gluconolactonase/LRE family protein [Cupriavidus]|uniref:SMP-30/gluconolactonase/LRE family protein n=1 Tax=Cupriavidus TaxID=106589 RepID=UPI00157A84F6|nr:MULTISPECIES: SMP-30/gluconolactonase/LRE family protein [Cupriavidus]MBB1632623.1 hypothetical protein [Cupriavidus sp. UME77]NUA27049.1 SMP-30/gluconolactonase/LRE family protein [Cupriavidus basilensis]